MKQILPDKRYLLASFADLKDFFVTNKVVGKTIKSIIPSAYDYQFSNLRECITNIDTDLTECCISTDESICLEFSDGNSLEILIPGSCPIIIGWNTFFKRTHDPYNIDCDCFDLNVLFEQCINHEITKVSVDYRENEMIFPAYMGIDLSEDDDFINGINLILDNDVVLTIEGGVDWCNVYLTNLIGEEAYVPVKKLFDSINSMKIKCFPEEFELLKYTIETLKDFAIDSKVKEYVDNLVNSIDNSLLNGSNESYKISINFRTDYSYEYVKISLEDECICVSCGGAVYDSDVGSDTFSSDLYTIYSDGSYEGDYYQASNRISSLLKCGGTLQIDGFDEFDDNF